MTWSGEQRHFVSYEPDQKKVEIEEGRTWVHGRSPEWFDRIHALEGYVHWGWCDHEGQITGSDIVCTNPYGLDLDEAAQIKVLADKYEFKVDITGASPWYPGRTVAIELEPTEKTYRILGLTPPAHAAFYQTPEYQIRQKRKELTGNADLIVPCGSHWHHEHVPGSCCPKCGEQCPNPRGVCPGK